MKLTLGLVLARKGQRINLQKVKGIPIVPSHTLISWDTQVRKDHSITNIMVGSGLSNPVQQTSKLLLIWQICSIRSTGNWTFFHGKKTKLRFVYGCSPLFQMTWREEQDISSGFWVLTATTESGIGWVFRTTWNIVLSQIITEGENNIPSVNSGQSIQRKYGTSCREATLTELARKQGVKSIWCTRCSFQTTGSCSQRFAFSNHPSHPCGHLTAVFGFSRI